MLGHFVQISEPSLAHLLQSASMVKRHGDVRLFRVEIGGRIVECDVPIFANAQKRDINRCRANRLAHAPNNLGGIFASIKQVRVRDARLRNQAFLKEFAEARRMRHGQTDVLIQME